MRTIPFVLAIVLAAPLRAQENPPPLVPRPVLLAPADSAARVQHAGAPLPSVALPAVLERVLRDYERAFRAGDAAALAALFTDDGFVLQGGRPPVRGRAAIERAYTGTSGGPLTLRALAHATADSVGYLIGAYTFDPAAGDQGKFTLTLRRGADGRWLIFSDMDNPSQPPRRMTPP